MLTAEIRDEGLAHVARGTCPHCSLPLKYNNAITGWYQCAAYGEPSFRKPEHRDAPKCSFQFIIPHE
jgi:hypothetical protein